MHSILMSNIAIFAVLLPAWYFPLWGMRYPRGCWTPARHEPMASMELTFPVVSPSVGSQGAVIHRPVLSRTG
jgi:hypothetical protein